LQKRRVARYRRALRFVVAFSGFSV
jgi:hypothetical protein